MFFFAGSAFAEDLTWGKVVEETAQNNADVQASREALRAAEYQYRAAFSGFFPQVSANYSYTHQNAPSVSSGTTSDQYSSATVNATENLFSGFQDRGKVDRAAANRDAAEAGLDITRAQATYDLRSAYAGLVYAQDAVVLADKISQRRDANLQLVEMNFEGGRENKGSYALSKANLDQALFEARQARDAVEVTGQQLAKVLGRAEGRTLHVTDKVPITTPGVTPDIEPLALLTPERRQAATQERANKALITVARSQFFPSLNATGSWGKQGDAFFSDESRWSVGFTVSLPIFNGGQDYFGTKAAIATLASSLSNEQGVIRQARANLKQKWTQYFEAVEKLKVDQEFVQAATLRSEIGRNKYNNGLLSFEDWDSIENDLVTKEKTLLQSERDRTIAEAAWEQAQGKGVIP